MKNKSPRGFSFGMKLRLSLAICLIIEPKFAIMDEPFVGLDPIGVKDLIENLKLWALEKNMTILISSHQLTELEELCSRFIFLENGKLKDDFNKEEKRFLELKLEDDYIGTNEKYKVMGRNLVIEIDDDFNEILKDISLNNKIVDMKIRENNLNRIFGGK